MVAHRLSTVRDADLVVVVNHGRVAELGTHERLLARDGLYRELWDAQHGDRRGAAAAAVPQDGLAAITTAIAEARESGGRLSGQPLAAMATAMAARESDEDPAWLLLGAALPLLQDGRADRLRELAARSYDVGDPREPAPRMAQQLLADLGLAEALEEVHR
jgi:hypothetical protein